MKVRWKLLLINLAIPLGIGLLAGGLTRRGVDVFGMVNKPPLSPPAWLFPIVWTVLYLMMGISSYLVMLCGVEREDVEQALHTYYLQLFFNFVWPILFFNLQWFLVAFVWLVVMWVLILRTILSFAKLCKPAALLLVPYLLWTTFAGYLNFGIYWLNR